ncbi:hypothetical protein GUITHDRAFT_150766 [Guillardia theta CCMP2712]|uniref:Uncharacterized protein n=1 Tax=Guillardia theta (strain CCMP2712) TaxID=905079 RepID=L1JVN6_GUITC|nr:hypothetical protein GUITHDRAFT_150766 [Guillardia theta CCMP2712]EKX52369.1 hypothetical protein GUITHDRAFT_150766 [Guillardia theta CCMP2712]|eukprot:XP_005839349.1 hypothetical protein GUITHDRAFT_150766 [Guillardia theta CCMP2712]
MPTSREQMLMTDSITCETRAGTRLIVGDPLLDLPWFTLVNRFRFTLRDLGERWRKDGLAPIS